MRLNDAVAWREQGWRDRLVCRGGGRVAFHTALGAQCRWVAGAGTALPSLLLTRAKERHYGLFGAVRRLRGGGGPQLGGSLQQLW